MFDSLDEQMERDEEPVTNTRRWFRKVAVLLISVAVFAGLYMAILFLE